MMLMTKIPKWFKRYDRTCIHCTGSTISGCKRDNWMHFKLKWTENCSCLLSYRNCSYFNKDKFASALCTMYVYCNYACCLCHLKFLSFCFVWFYFYYFFYTTFFCINLFLHSCIMFNMLPRFVCLVFNIYIQTVVIIVVTFSSRLVQTLSITAISYLLLHAHTDDKCDPLFSLFYTQFMNEIRKENQIHIQADEDGNGRVFPLQLKNTHTLRYRHQNVQKKWVSLNSKLMHSEFSLYIRFCQFSYSHNLWLVVAFQQQHQNKTQMYRLLHNLNISVDKAGCNLLIVLCSIIS